MRDKLRMIKTENAYGWFHKWVKKEGNELALVENENGTMALLGLDEFRFLSDFEKIDYEHKQVFKHVFGKDNEE